MIRRPPRSTRTDTLFPYTTLFRSLVAGEEGDAAGDHLVQALLQVTIPWRAEIPGPAARRRCLLDGGEIVGGAPAPAASRPVGSDRHLLYVAHLIRGGGRQRRHDLAPGVAQHDWVGWGGTRKS